ncbi:MAG: hypothetical protein H7281_15160 [Bacteriovorax sp.]|nr:hypothetical protein [Bacteriovorax sp.]
MNLEEFLDNAHSLGIKINRSAEKRRDYIDLESFFLYSTIHISSSIRVARYIEYWAFSFGKYLSVKRINDHIKKGHPYKPEFLNGLLKIIDENFDKSGPMKNLFQKKTGGTKGSIPIVPGFEFKKLDPKWESVGVSAPIFIPDELAKTIQGLDWISKNCPEIYYRMQGISPVLSDIRAYMFFKNKVSLYRVAKDLSLTYACVHQNYKKYLEPFGINVSNS